MPSFRLLDEDELDALVHYVEYLSIRGEVERQLIMEMALDERALQFEGEGGPLKEASLSLLDEVLGRVARPWIEAQNHITDPAPPPWNDWDRWDPQEKLASRERGRHLYYGLVANCVKCHGDTQLGDGQLNEYDDWSKDFFDWVTATDAKKKEEMMSELVALGGLPPRNIIPRNLRQGVYRGGRRLIDVYRRIHDGIAGTPMPAVPMKPEGAPADTPGLTPADIWDLVNYVQSLPYEPLSQPLRDRPTYSRERM
jgi:cytochrome c